MLSRKLLWVLVAFIALTPLVGCSDDDDDDNVVDPPVTIDQFEVVRETMDAYLASGADAVIKADVVFDNINDGDTTNDPHVISVRSLDDYNLGHVPGADNIPWRDIADAASLATVPGGEDIVIYCYTGHTGAVATTVLSALGYNAQNMKFGIMSWTKDATIRVASAFDEAADAHDYPVETTPNTPTVTYDPPVLDVSSSSENSEIVRAAAEAYVGDDTVGAVITAAVLFDNVNDGDDSNDYVIVSVRSAEDYALGHIPGAINIPWREIAQSDKLAMLPPDKPIAVYCYTGHTGGVATTTLRMLGYEAVNMKWGMVSWTTDPVVRVATAFSEETEAHDYPTE